MNNCTQYVWLNPVVEKMAGKDGPVLSRMLRERGYEVVTCSNQADRIRGLYGKYIEESEKKVVIDARCPAVVQLIKAEFPEVLEYMAPIPPILIACAYALYGEYIERSSGGAVLTVVTPCTQLAHQGDSIFGGKIRFVTWKAFQSETGFGNTYEKPASSPIPLGFFDPLPIEVRKASGRENIRETIRCVCANETMHEARLLELLYCPDGCHNGDGIAQDIGGEEE